MAKASFGFPAAALRAQALGEVHSRPYALVTTPRVIFQLAFITEGGSIVDHAVLSELSRARGIAPPGRDANHHAMPWGQGTLRWERHTEFSTYFWDAPAPGTVRRRGADPSFRRRFLSSGLVDFRHPP
ncbi:putative membrane-anchored protein [Sinorhizobium fredii]